MAVFCTLHLHWQQVAVYLQPTFSLHCSYTESILPVHSTSVWECKRVWHSLKYHLNSKLIKFTKNPAFLLFTIHFSIWSDLEWLLLHSQIKSHDLVFPGVRSSFMCRFMEWMGNPIEVSSLKTTALVYTQHEWTLLYGAFQCLIPLHLWDLSCGIKEEQSGYCKTGNFSELLIWAYPGWSGQELRKTHFSQISTGTLQTAPHMI